MRGLSCAVGVALLAFCGCSLLEDNGTHLAYALEKGAKQLKSKPDGSELVVRYEPLTGINQSYGVSFRASPSEDPPYGAASLSVGGSNGGSTTYHQRFLYVPKEFNVDKMNAATFLTLRKNGNRIELVGVR
jgi:hypothetical protein